MLEKYLDKLPVKEIYDDLFSPGLKKAGEALETILDIPNSLLIPLKLLNSKARLNLKQNLKRYEEKLNSTKNLTSIQVPHNIGIPIINKLMEISEDKLAETFINLLTKSTFQETIKFVHPAYLNVLHNLSVDEATILYEYKNYEMIPFIDIYVNKYPKNVQKSNIPNSTTFQDKKVYNFEDKPIAWTKAHLKAAWNLTGIEHKIKLMFPNNIDIYIDNLGMNGIISFERNEYYLQYDNDYKNLKEYVYKDKIQEIYSTLNNDENQKFSFRIQVKNAYIFYTEFGRGFIKA